MAFGYPDQTTPVHVASGNVANASAVATIPAISGKTPYVTGFEITAGGATAAGLVQATLAGLRGGTATYIFGAPAGAAVQAAPLIVQFTSPLQGTPDAALTLTLPGLGAGNTNAAVTLHGFYAG